MLSATPRAASDYVVGGHTPCYSRDTLLPDHVKGSFVHNHIESDHTPCHTKCSLSPNHTKAGLMTMGVRHYLRPKMGIFDISQSGSASVDQAPLGIDPNI